MITSRKHAKLIKAWADGAEIEWFAPSNEWLSVGRPSWHDNQKYRIKPESKPDIVVNLSITFDGETGEIKSTEVLK